MNTDREVLDSMGRIMACAPDWGADVLDTVAELVSMSGRPHPGGLFDDQDPDDEESSETVARWYQSRLDERLPDMPPGGPWVPCNYQTHYGVIAPLWSVDPDGPTGWSGYCGIPTSDESGLCHHHFEIEGN